MNNEDLTEKINREEQELAIRLSSHIERSDLLFLEMNKKLDDIVAKLEPIVDVYRAVLFSKTFVAGFALVIVSIGAIGAGVIWFINNITKVK